MQGRACFGLLALFLSTAVAAKETPESTARRVDQLADKWFAEMETRFPVTFLGSGLPPERHDLLEQNAPTDLAQWREFIRSAEKELAQLPEAALIGQPQWVTWHYMKQGLTQARATQLCRNELWQVSAFGWQTHIAHIAALQPVGTEISRSQALTRWRALPRWIDQEIANLREGLRLGYSATQQGVRSTLAQFDALVAETPSKSHFMGPAERDGTPEFREQWTRLLEQGLWPALRRYRDFLRDEYLPKARTTVSLKANKDGLACYQATIFASTTVDADLRRMFDEAQARHRQERDLALQIGRSVFGEKATDWASLGTLVKTDPRNKFASAEEIGTYAQATVDRAMRVMDRMVLDPPPGAIKLSPFPQYAQASGPGGEYVPGSDDGSRAPMFYFRNDPTTSSRGTFEALIFHETVPGHHLQAAVLAQNQQKALHPITRVLWFAGPGEGWATYAEGFARELGLYSSDFEALGSLLSSTTPPMVADLGMQVMGWSTDQATQYLLEAQPLRGKERTERMVANIGAMPGQGVAYPLGAMQFEHMRALAEKQLGAHFDIREFHRVMLEDGRLPFPAVRSKLDRWIATKKRSPQH